MGNSSFIKFFSNFFGKKQFRILILGFDGAGKTTILYNLKLGQVVPSVPTVGFNVESVQVQNVKFTAWDVSGGWGIRKLWKHYYEDTKAIVYVVDSSDLSRIKQVAEQLQSILSQNILKDVPLLVFSNKNDMNVMSKQQVVQKLGLQKLKERQWHIEATCATDLKDQKIKEGFKWLSKTLIKHNRN